MASEKYENTLEIVKKNQSIIYYSRLWNKNAATYEAKSWFGTKRKSIPPVWKIIW
jgi:hypothetical protein